jgi:hypothetical protein
MRASRWLWLGTLLAVATPGIARAADDTDRVRAYIRAREAAAAAHARLPSFSRQTGLACSACHYQFLALTPFGREFKLKGYTLTARELITEKDSTNGNTLKLSPIPLVSAMVQASLTHTTDAQPDRQNDAASLPQQLSLFLAGQVTSKLGIFSQLTYAGADGTFGIDNIDLRYASSTRVGGTTDLIYGVTLNNNPTVQDVWNTTPAWGFPFASSDVAPGAIAGTVIDGALAQQAVGLGAYTLIGGLVYAEFSAYRSALQGRALPDSFALSGVAPYWRLALQKTWPNQYLMFGTYGLRANQYPGAVSGPTDHFTDIGIDAQFETRLSRGSLVARGTWIREHQTLDATFGAGGSENPKNTLKTFRANASYYPVQQLGVTVGYFQTTGTVDTLRYAPAAVSGSANGDPKTNGVTGELDFNGWQNARLGLQYTIYDRFNGGKAGYDGFGRRATGNNTLYLLAWLVF